MTKSRKVFKPESWDLLAAGSRDTPLILNCWNFWSKIIDLFFFQFFKNCFKLIVPLPSPTLAAKCWDWVLAFRRALRCPVQPIYPIHRWQLWKVFKRLNSPLWQMCRGFRKTTHIAVVGTAMYISQKKRGKPDRNAESCLEEGSSGKSHNITVVGHGFSQYMIIPTNSLYDTGCFY